MEWQYQSWLWREKSLTSSCDLGWNQQWNIPAPPEWCRLQLWRDLGASQCSLHRTCWSHTPVMQITKTAGELRILLHGNQIRHAVGCKINTDGFSEFFHHDKPYPTVLSLNFLSFIWGFGSSILLEATLGNDYGIEEVGGGYLNQY